MTGYSIVERIRDNINKSKALNANSLEDLRRMIKREKIIISNDYINRELGLDIPSEEDLQEGIYYDN